MSWAFLVQYTVTGLMQLGAFHWGCTCVAAMSLAYHQPQGPVLLVAASWQMTDADFMGLKCP